MARHLRLEYEGAIYHVTARGNERGAIFKLDCDRVRFLEKLAECAGDFHVRVYAYVLMTNHYHLLIETPRGNLSAFMHRLNTSYTMYYNVRARRVGHLFSGRYKAKVVEGDAYLLKLTRYIHLNPVKIRSAAETNVVGRMGLLREYPWSSYRSYMGTVSALPWMDYSPLMELAGCGARDKQAAYREYVEAGVAVDDGELSEVLKLSSRAIGRVGFRRWVNAELKKVAGTMGSAVDVTLRRQEEGVDAESVVKTVCRICGVEPEALRRRRSLDESRLVGVKALLGSTGLSRRAIAQTLGLRDGSGLRCLVSRADVAMKSDRSLRRKLEMVEHALAS